MAGWCFDVLICLLFVAKKISKEQLSHQQPKNKVTCPYLTCSHFAKNVFLVCKKQPQSGNNQKTVFSHLTHELKRTQTTKQKNTSSLETNKKQTENIKQNKTIEHKTYIQIKKPKTKLKKNNCCQVLAQELRSVIKLQPRRPSSPLRDEALGFVGSLGRGQVVGWTWKGWKILMFLDVFGCFWCLFRFFLKHKLEDGWKKQKKQQNWSGLLQWSSKMVLSLGIEFERIWVDGEYREGPHWLYNMSCHAYDIHHNHSNTRSMIHMILHIFPWNLLLV